MLYNRNAYNRAPYNRASGRDLKCSVLLISSTSLTSAGVLAAYGAVKFESSATFTNKVLHDLFSSASSVVGAADMIVLEAITEKIFGASLGGEARLVAVPALGYSASTIVLSGSANISLQGGRIFSVLAGYSGNSDFLSAPSVESPRSIALSGTSDVKLSGGHVERFASTILSSSANMQSTSVMLYGARSALNGLSNFLTVPMLDYRAQTSLFSGAELNANAWLNYMSKTDMTGTGAIFASFEALVQEGAIFEGTLNPGDILVINSCDYTATLNGENALEEYGGDWINLNEKSMNVHISTDGASDMDAKIDFTPTWY